MWSSPKNSGEKEPSLVDLRILSGKRALKAPPLIEKMSLDSIS
jgi:hypothetical protein